MEMVLKNEFCELNLLELNEVNGGSGMDAFFATTGTVAVAWAPVVAFFNPPVALAMATLGSAAVLVACGVDADIIKY